MLLVQIEAGLKKDLPSFRHGKLRVNPKALDVDSNWVRAASKIYLVFECFS